MTFHLVRAWGHTCWSCPGSKRVCSIKGTWQWPLHITRTQSSWNIQIHMKSVHTRHVLDNHFLRVPNKCAYVCILELNHLVYPPPLLPITPQHHPKTFSMLMRKMWDGTNKREKTWLCWNCSCFQFLVFHQPQLRRQKKSDRQRKKECVYIQ